MALDAGVGRYRGFALLAIAMTGTTLLPHIPMLLTYRINRINRRDPRQQTVNISSYDPPSEINYTERFNRTAINVDTLGPLIPDNGLFLCIRLLGWMD